MRSSRGRTFKLERQLKETCAVKFRPLVTRRYSLDPRCSAFDRSHGPNHADPFDSPERTFRSLPAMRAKTVSTDRLCCAHEASRFSCLLFGSPADHLIFIEIARASA